MHVIGVKFKKEGKTYNFSSEIEYKVGDYVIVETERSLELGKVATVDEEPFNKNYKEIIGLATDEDYNKYLKNQKDANKALLETKKVVKKLKLNMNLINAIYSFDRKILLFNFVSEERVDFRELVKELAGMFHTRIELHQIGVRDKAKEIGGIGLCGRKLCCNVCLRNVNPVNINMVKNQNIALNPTKINGACGRLLCCFAYENDLYEEAREKLPKIGERVSYNGKEGVVTELDILNKKYKLKLANDKIEEVLVDDRAE